MIYILKFFCSCDSSYCDVAEICKKCLSVCREEVKPLAYVRMLVFPCI